MGFWNFSHDTLGMHVYLLLALVVVIVMVIVGIVHGAKQKNREKEFNDELSGNKDQTVVGPETSK